MPGVVVVLHDITELRQLEDMRRNFVANVSHELKTPLASIKAYAETLKLGAINDQQRNLQFVEQIESQADFLNQQIQDLLQLARIESGQAAWDIERVNLNRECEQCVSRFAELAHANNIALSLKPGDPPPLARADVEGFATVLNNLITNALSYTPAGGDVCVSTFYKETLRSSKSRTPELELQKNIKPGFSSGFIESTKPARATKVEPGWAFRLSNTSFSRSAEA